MNIRIGSNGKLFIGGRLVGEINKEVLEDEDIRSEVRKELMKERSRWLRRVRSEKINLRKEIEL